jgi:hypothetical protein
MAQVRLRFTLKSLFGVTAIIAILLANFFWVGKLISQADRAAIRSDYREGRLTRQRALELLGDNANLPERPDTVTDP